MTEEMKEQLFDHPVVFQTEKLHFEAYLWRVMLEFFLLIRQLNLGGGLDMGQGRKRLYVCRTK